MESSVHSKREPAESTAAAWVARRELECWSEADETALRSWIEADFNHRAAWLRLSAAWQQTERLRNLSADCPSGAVPAPSEIRIPLYDAHLETDPVSAVHREPLIRLSKSLRYRWLAAGAAAALVAVLASGHLWSSRSLYRTDIGALQAVPLPDGSRVTLNTDTALRVEVTRAERRIELERGEAYFEVTKDAARPFIVVAGEKRIVAVGTQFSVRRAQSDVQVIVTEGLVRVDDTAASALSRKVSSAVLAAGSIARAGHDGVLVQRKSVADLEQSLSWRSGYLIFDETPLSRAVAEFNRYNARQIIVQDPSVAIIPIGGNFKAANAAAFLRLIETDFPVVADREGNEIVLRRKPASHEK